MQSVDSASKHNSLRKCDGAVVSTRKTCRWQEGRCSEVKQCPCRSLLWHLVLGTWKFVSACAVAPENDLTHLWGNTSALSFAHLRFRVTKVDHKSNSKERKSLMSVTGVESVNGEMPAKQDVSEAPATPAKQDVQERRSSEWRQVSNIWTFGTHTGGVMLRNMWR